jgi:hypothetical protein
MLLPHMNRVAQAVFGDWDLSYIYSYQSGPPIAFGNVLLTGSAKDIPLSSSARTAAQWFNINAFNRVTAQQLANNLITLSPTFAGIRAASYNASDSSLNIFNQTSFGVPNVAPTNAAFGAVTTQKNVPRRLQAMLRIQF